MLIFVEMNSIATKLYDKYKEELQNLQLGYPFDSKNVREMLDLIYMDLYLESGYATDVEFLKYLKRYA